MATGPYHVYNKASEYQTKVGVAEAADFSGPGVATVVTGLSNIVAAYVTMNGDPAGTTGTAQISVDISGGSIVINQWTDAHAAAGVEVDVSWMAIGT